MSSISVPRLNNGTFRLAARFKPAVAGLIILVVTGGMGSHPPDLPPASPARVVLDRYKADMISYFKPLGLLPIIVPENQAVGDVYVPTDDEYWRLRDDAKRCFPSLAPSQAQPGLLPAVTLNSSDEAGLALGVAKLLDLSTSARKQQKYIVTFGDVTSKRATMGELQDSLDAKCEYLRPVVYEGTVPLADMAVTIVVGKVFYARPMVFIGSEEGVDAKARLSGLQQMLPGIASLALRDLDAEASATLGFGRRNGILAESKVTIPVAFAPAFLIKPVFDHALGAGSNAAVLKGYAWRAFDDASVDQKRLFEELVGASVTSPSK